MKIIFPLLLCFCFQFTIAQKLDISSLEKILYASFTFADSMLKNSKFSLSDKETGNVYYNYYYTSVEKVSTVKQILRSVSVMDVYGSKDTSRLILYRTYEKDDEEEMKKQLLYGGYELINRSGNDFVYKKGDYTITNRISEKNLSGGKPVTAYEFELGR
jgi:hypothetical protein